jgi:hypothetical protein
MKEVFTDAKSIDSDQPEQKKQGTTGGELIPEVIVSERTNKINRLAFEMKRGLRSIKRDIISLCPVSAGNDDRYLVIKGNNKNRRYNSIVQIMTLVHVI